MLYIPSELQYKRLSSTTTTEEGATQPLLVSCTTSKDVAEKPTPDSPLINQAPFSARTTKALPMLTNLFIP